MSEDLWYIITLGGSVLLTLAGGLYLRYQWRKCPRCNGAGVVRIVDALFDVVWEEPCPRCRLSKTSPPDNQQ